jgi:hypothetical protein
MAPWLIMHNKSIHKVNFLWPTDERDQNNPPFCSKDKIYHTISAVTFLIPFLPTVCLICVTAITHTFNHVSESISCWMSNSFISFHIFLTPFKFFMPLKGIWLFHGTSTTSLYQYMQALTHPFASLCTKLDVNTFLQPTNAHSSNGTNSHTEKQCLFHYCYVICFSNIQHATTDTAKHMAACLHPGAKETSMVAF